MYNFITDNNTRTNIQKCIYRSSVLFYPLFLCYKLWGVNGCLNTIAHQAKYEEDDDVSARICKNQLTNLVIMNIHVPCLFIYRNHTSSCSSVNESLWTFHVSACVRRNSAIAFVTVDFRGDGSDTNWASKVTCAGNQLEQIKACVSEVYITWSLTTKFTMYLFYSELI